MKNQEQRLYFRIDTVLPCSFRIISSEDAKSHELPKSADNKFIEEYFMKNLADLDQQINESIAQINEKSSVLATALNAINSKLNFIMQTLEESQLSRAIPLRVVNISGNGIALHMNEDVSLTDKVDLLIKPLHNEPPILVRCDVVNIKRKNDDGETKEVSLSFQTMAVEDRRKLIFFIQSKEIEAAQKEREKKYP